MSKSEDDLISEAMRLLGSRTSAAKAAAVRENGKKGGRPKQDGSRPCAPGKRRGRPKTSNSKGK